jgi:hypothetical protein
VTVTIREVDEAAQAAVIAHFRARWPAGSDQDLRAFVRWRFARPVSSALAAIQGDGRCVGFLSWVVRPYRIRGTDLSIRETSDWYTSPDYRSGGLGLTLMRRVMAQDAPILTIGGSTITLQILPRLRWQELKPVRTFVRILRLGAVIDVAEHRLGVRKLASAPLFARSLPVSRAARARAPGSGWEAGAADPARAASVAAGGGNILQPVVGEDEIRWYAAAPACAGRFVLREYRDAAGHPVGVGIVRLIAIGRWRGARVMHVGAAEWDLRLFQWIISDLSAVAEAFGAESVRAVSSSRIIGHAYRGTGFRERQALPTYLWDPGKRVSAEETAFDFTRGDDGFVPHPFSGSPRDGAAPVAGEAS